ncbi:hypothetical protein BFINE_36030 [Bacteroides finegoldii DSM 17565]|nr:hypothetical protein BFINE_36030 [Bacteroides finegoldii DSM 17565]
MLYLGIDTELFQPQSRPRDKLHNIAFIGNNIRYKGIDDFYAIAEKFPELTFHIVGGGIGYDVVEEIGSKGLRNCVYHGLMDHTQISEFLKGIDLHIFPSRSEGFPKVTLETAAMGYRPLFIQIMGPRNGLPQGKMVMWLIK